MAYTKDEVLKVINRFRKEIEGMLHTDRVYLFGSYATGHAKDYSDIDVAIVSADITDENYFDMKRLMKMLKCLKLLRNNLKRWMSMSGKVAIDNNIEA